MRKWLCFLALAALTLNAAEVTGKWSGSFDITNSAGETKDDNAWIELKETGGAVTGTAGPDIDKQWEIRKGKLEGQKLPTVIMAHGWGGTAAGFRPDAVELAHAGYLVITFDYRGWGESDSRVILVESEPPAGTTRNSRRPCRPFAATSIRPNRSKTGSTSLIGRRAIQWSIRTGSVCAVRAFPAAMSFTSLRAIRA